MSKWHGKNSNARAGAIRRRDLITSGIAVCGPHSAVLVKSQWRHLWSISDTERVTYDSPVPHPSLVRRMGHPLPLRWPSVASSLPSAMPRTLREYSNYEAPDNQTEIYPHVGRDK